MRRRETIGIGALGRQPERKTPMTMKEKRIIGRQTRRGALGILGGAALAGGLTWVGSTVLDKFRRQPTVAPEHREELISYFEEHKVDAQAAARLEVMSQSPLFFAELASEMSRYQGAELALALKPENGRARTLNDPEGRSRIDYIQQEIMNGVTTIPADICEELTFYAPGMYGVESKFQNDLTSEATARFIVQGLPSTYKDYGYTDDDMQYLTKQVAFGKEYLVHMYTVLTTDPDAGPALEKIQQEYFPGDEERFRRQFLSLCLVNVYKAGIGNMLKVVTEFAKRDPNPRFEKYDVFAAMTKAAEDGSFSSDYRERAAIYPKGAAAFAFLLNGADTSVA